MFDRNKADGLGPMDDPWNDDEKSNAKSTDGCDSTSVYSRFSNESTSKDGEFSQLDINEILPGDEGDDDMPAITIRSTLLAFTFGTVVAGVDSFFNMRFPTIAISTSVVLIVTYPCGVLLASIVPNWHIPLPRGHRISLNPGPFNYKEHASIFIFTNVINSAGLVNNLVIEDFKFFKVNTGIPRQILFNMSCYLISIALVGFFRPVLVTPVDRIWPGVLSTISLFKVIYSRENHVANGWKMHRWVYLVIVLLASFVWYWFPDFILPFLGPLGAWISWIRPESASLSQAFGVTTGLGIFPLTLDWTNITSINNPLTTPFWVVLNIFISFIFWIYIVMVGLYYTNHWQTGHFPIMTNKIFTVDGKKYQFEKVADKNWKLDNEKFQKYSPAMLPIAFLMQLSLNLGAFSSMVIHFILRFKGDVIDPWRARGSQNDYFNNTNFKVYGWWIYIIPLVIGLAFGFSFTEGWNDAPLDAGGFTVAVVIACILYAPLSLVEARANTMIPMTSFFYIISANWYPGQPLKLLYFYSFGLGIIQHAMHMTQGAKVGHYLRIKPREYMVILLVAGLWSSCVSPSVTGYILNHFDSDICTSKAKNNMTCRKVVTAFNTHGIWGLFGSHFFAPGGRYKWILWFFLAGPLVAIAQFTLAKLKPRSFVSKFDPVLFFAGAENIPSVTGYNYTTWFVVAFIFNFMIHKYFNPWWRKYNLVTSFALDCGVAVAAIVIYFAVVYTGGSEHYKWWGTEIHKKGCDAKGCPNLTGPVSKPSGY